MLYSDDCKANGALDDPKKLREAYGALSYQDKYKWILKAVSESPEVCGAVQGYIIFLDIWLHAGCILASF